MTAPYVLPIVGVVLTLILASFLLPFASVFTRVWVGLYTLPLHPEIRDRRREEIAADVWTQRQADSDDGYKPAEVGLRLLIRTVRGAPADIAWSLPKALDQTEFVFAFGMVTVSPLVFGMPWLVGDPFPSFGPVSGDIAIILMRLGALWSMSRYLKLLQLTRRARFAYPPVTLRGEEGTLLKYRHLDEYIRAQPAARGRWSVILAASSRTGRLRGAGRRRRADPAERAVADRLDAK